MRNLRRGASSRCERLYDEFVSPGDIVFDVGANVGERTATFVSLGARVVAVEPQADCAARLRERFGDRVEVVEAAAGSAAGEAELLVASYHTISSLSREWVDAVRASGRFSAFAWDRKVRVPVVTLDDLIHRFGHPAFCKIDVEGYELQVLEGLTQAVPALSFEFTFELIESRLACVDRLDALGMSRFNFSEGESMRLVHDTWLTAGEIRQYLRGTPETAAFFGDVYAAVCVARKT